ncbi:hypothetical protein EIL87_25395 [Saccharopolyspora rhizosphaerae]|uniref:Uncharacterized protein n=1 Tax=Saccharopolyspora rhizosphaerae TaxID=2492662 RepID=A0A426JIZ2_9PSEU|nr:hypothetical protein [Saccharopolyspora rhizosphaerae]RRO13000.1 hypothetical protein EIL87_25395 [Saccharopolyspora rhizosphaerae]
MADQREPRSDNLPEIVDAEVVEVAETEDAPRARAPKATDDPEYQEFLEFKRFKEWQAAQGGDTTAPVAEKPWWKQALGLLRLKWVRRALYVIIALLLLNLAYDHYFGEGDGSSSESGTGGSAPVDAVPVTAQNPQQAVRSLHNYLRAQPPEQACALFDDDGKADFAAAHGAPDCGAAARSLHAQITDPNAYANPRFDHDAVVEMGAEAQVRGCRMRVTGGPTLGTFKLTRTPQGGWTISAYALTSATCP